MANSGYYSGLYRKYKEEAQKYEKNIKELQSVLNTLNGDFAGKQREVNRELNDLSEDLHKAVRHDPQFTAIADKCGNYRENAASADPNLSAAAGALDNEIGLLKSKKETAEQNRDYYYKKYLEEKEKEKQEFLDSLKSLF